MYYTEDWLKQKIQSLQTEKENLENIIWCKTFECNEYSKTTIRELAFYLQDVDRMISSLKAILSAQYEVTV